MEIVTTTTTDLGHVLAELSPRINGKPVYRALDDISCTAYRNSGLLIPRDGEAYVAGKGVFFFFDPHPVCNYLTPRPIVVVSSFEKLSQGRKTIDTRVSGFDLEAAAILDREKGHGNYNGYELWLKVMEDDTITASLAENSRFPDGLPIYTRRTPVRMDELDFEIVLTDVPLSLPEDAKIEYT